MILSALILSSHLLHKFTVRFSHDINSGSILLFQITLYLYCHGFISGLYLLFLSWVTINAILKVITSSPLPLINQRRHYHNLYGFWSQSPRNQFHQWNSTLYCYPVSWVILSSVLTWYNGMTHPGSFIVDSLYITYHCTFDIDQLLDLSPSVYW